MVIRFDLQQALDLVSQLEREDFQPLAADVELVARTAFLIPLVHRYTGIQLDLAIGVSGFEQQVVSRATQMQIAEQQLNVATAEDLILMKVLAGRPQDDQDVRGLVDVGGSMLDWDYCVTVAEQLDQALATDLASRIRSLRVDFNEGQSSASE